MASAHHRYARRKVYLCVAVLNETLSLCTHNIVGKIEDARSWWGPRDRRDGIVVLCRPANGREVKGRVCRSSVVCETAEADIHADDGRWSDRVGISESSGITCVFFRTTVSAQARSEWIDGQIKNIPIGVAEEDALFVGKNVVESSYDLVLVPAAAGGRCVVVGDDPRLRINCAGSVGCREVLEQS